MWENDNHFVIDESDKKKKIKHNNNNDILSIQKF